MAKLSIEQLMKIGDLLPAAKLKEKKDAQAKAQKAFEDAVIEQERNQRFQTPKATGSITKKYQREKFEG